MHDLQLARIAGDGRMKPNTVYETNWRPWPSFEKHHYLKLPRMIAATCYVATSGGEPVAHVAVGTNAGMVSARMCRLVVMPEWQGAGVGRRLMDIVAERWLRGRNRYGKPMTTPSITLGAKRSSVDALVGHPNQEDRRWKE